jgi:hypothetical protein
LLRPVRRFFGLDAGRRRLLLQAFGRLGSVRLALRRTSFREMIRGLGVHPGEVASPELAPADRRRAEDIGWAVRAASRYTPWSSTCLVQVLAAQQLLRERAIPGAFYIGAAPGEAGGAAVGLQAHAWLKCGEQFITGEAGHQRYTVVSTFSWS